VAFKLLLPARVREIRDRDPLLVNLMALFLAVKLGLLLTALLGSRLLPFNSQLYQVNLVLDVQDLPPAFRFLNTWDTQHYLLLSQRGYGVNPMSNAFYPLYPYLIWAFSPLFLNYGLIAAYVIANAASMFVPVYMYKLCCLSVSKEQAFRSTVLLLAFPTAFFLSVAYSEALYLSVCLAAFYYLLKKDVRNASLLCFLLPLTRAQALLFVVPLLVLFAEALFAERARPGGDPRSALKIFAPPLLATLAGMVVYFAICQWTLGDFRAGLAAQRLYVADNALGNLLHPLQWLSRNFLDLDFRLHGYTNSLIDRAAFLLAAPLLIGIYRTQSRALFTYAALTLLIPAFAGNFMSYTRVLLVVFPMFLYLGTFVRRFELVAVPMFALQVLLYLLHTNGYWVA